MLTAKKEALQDTSLPEIEPTMRHAGMWCFVAAGVLATFYLATSLYISSHRLLWFDEIATVQIARLPRWVSIWTALGRGADSLPPIYYMVVRAFGKPFGYSEIAVRLPSTVAMVAGLLITFDCARRLTDGLHGLIALSVITCSFLPYYGYETRSYGIFFMLAALALWVWTYSKDGKWLSAILFGTVLFLGVTIHYYFVLCLVPYVLCEIFRRKRWQPPSRILIAGIVGVAVPSVLLSPLALAFSRNFSSGYYDRPSLPALVDIFSHLFPVGLFLLALITVWIVLVGGEERTMVLQTMQPGEAVGWLFLCIPLAGFVAAELKTNAFADRCFVGALPGIAVAFSCCLWRHFRNTLRVSLGIFLLLASAGVARQLTVARHLELADRFGLQSATKEYLRLEGALQTDGKRYISFSPGMLYMGAQYYSKYSGQLILLRGPKEDPRHSDLLFSLLLDQPAQWWNMDDLKVHARETALIQPTPETLETMKRAGLKVEVRFSKPLEVVYLQ